MKLKKVIILVENTAQTSERWARALKGRALKKTRGSAIISVPNWDVLGRIFSPPRLQILAAVLEHHPPSIAALARRLKRDFKNVHADVTFLADVGLLELRQEGTRRALVPMPIYSEIDVPLAA